jgi:hypothetical protein
MNLHLYHLVLFLLFFFSSFCSFVLFFSECDPLGEGWIFPSVVTEYIRTETETNSRQNSPTKQISPKTPKTPKTPKMPKTSTATTAVVPVVPVVPVPLTTDNFTGNFTGDPNTGDPYTGDSNTGDSTGDGPRKNGIAYRDGTRISLDFGRSTEW